MGETIKVKLIDLCSGIGGFHLGLKQAGFEAEEEYYSEIDKNAEKIYKRHFRNAISLGNIKTIDPTRFIFRRNNNFFITGGFPCQSFSMAGKRFGFNDTRGTIFFDIIRIAKHVRPKYMLLENVKGLVNHDEGRTFKRIIRTLAELRIFETIEWFVFNSKNHGVAQNRERIFIFCSRGGSEGQVLLERERNKEVNTQKSRKIIVADTNIGGQRGEVLSSEGISSCLTATDYKQPKQIAPNKSEIIVVGNNTRSGHNSANVYSKEGISSTLALSHPTQIALEHIEPQQVTNFQGKPLSNALRSGGRGTYTDKHNWDTIIIAGTLRTHKDGEGFRELKEGICPTIPARAREDGSGQPVIQIKSANTEGFENASEGDSINLTAINSKTRRGRVGKNMVHTLDTKCEQGIVEKIETPSLTSNQGESKLDLLGVIKKDCTKRLYDTPKEINEFLKNHKKGKTISEIAKHLDLNKSQVEHYFRTDKHRAIPNKEIWNKLKAFLDLPSDYDKLVLSEYEKIIEYEQTNRVYNSSGLSPTVNATCEPTIAIPVLTPDRAEKRQNGRRFKTNDEPSFTLTAQDKHGVYNGKTIRRITPLECERLQGFPDDWTRRDCDNNEVPDTTRYKALGNAVTVNVIEYIGRNIIEGQVRN